MTHLDGTRTNNRIVPHGRHRGQGGQEREACPRRIHRFLEPCLLLLLHCEEVHGYELLESLHPFGFAQNPLDPSTVYRLLRNLEDDGLITSRWDTSNAGPARRLCCLTEAGDLSLARWVKDLRETDRVLHTFLNTYRAHMEAHEGEGKPDTGGLEISRQPLADAMEKIENLEKES